MKTKFGQFISKKSFPVCFFLLLTLSLIYITFRSGSVCKQLWNINIYGWMIAVLFAVFVLHLFFQKQQATSTAYRIFFRIEGFALCFLLYFILSLICCDLTGFIVHLFYPNPIVYAVAWVISVMVSFGLTIYGTVHARRLKTVRYDVALGKGESAYNIVLLSDLHIGIYVSAGYIKNLVRRINSLSPDMVVIAGDIFNNGSAEECAKLAEVSRLFRQIHTKDGVFAVLGNHDPAFSDEAMQKFLRDSNIRLLYNEVYPTPLFNLVGRNDMLHTINHKETRSPLKDLLAKTPGNKPVIVLDHNPDGIDEATDNKIDLVLCGHTHKGQLSPFIFLTRISHKKEHFYGKNDFGQTQSIISAGTGYFQLPVRVGTDSEIVYIKLKI